ncbi:uncharacterized protein [Drosophila kikkawai]|uniref:Uncharacterized protein n=1 Tax=Drosophila kikkawai TaxID=30033 RepID=A0ABM4GPV0_DROKI
MSPDRLTEHSDKKARKQQSKSNKVGENRSKRVEENMHYVFAKVGLAGQPRISELRYRISTWGTCERGRLYNRDQAPKVLNKLVAKANGQRTTVPRRSKGVTVPS